jgi:GAF domain-containing protein/CheY-like chemotaxis protein
MSPQGKTLRLINRDVGLQDESVYAIFPDKNGAVWLGLDNGISRIETTSPFTQFTIQSGITTAVLSAARFEGKLYIGTSNGLLRFNQETSRFESVKSIQTNQVFGLIEDEGKLLIPTDGLFYIKDGKTHVIRPSYGGDLQVQSTYLLKKTPGILLTGLAGGLAMFSKHPNTKSSPQSSAEWTYAGKIGGITEDTWSVIERNDGSVWLGGINGVIRLSNFVDKDGVPVPDKARIERFGPAQGLSGGAIHVFSIPGKELFVSNSGVFRYDESKNRFVPDNSFGPMGFGNDPNEYNMTVDQRERVWINFGKETALATPQGNGTYRIEKTQFLPFTDRVVFKIYPEDNGIVWFATNEGLIRYDENRQKDYTQSFKTLLRQITAGETSLSTVAAPANHNHLPFRNNTLRFEYAAPWFEKENRTKYQTWLEGFEPGWSGWDNNSYKEYTNLPDGNYKFHVRALNIYQKPSEEAIYNFIILPPLWRTWWAYLFYALLVVGAIYWLIRWRTNKLQAKHRELEKVVSERTAELSHRVEELAVINSVQEALVSEMSMEGIYEMVGEKIREIFNAQVIDIVTYDKKTGLLEDHYSYEKGDRTLVGKWEPRGFRKHVIETGQVFIINKDLDAISEQFGSSVIYGEQPKSCVFVPLISNGEVNGMISLQDLDKENAFSDSAVNLLTTLANSMSVALESARRFDETNRLLKETEQRNAELAVINSVQDGLVREMDMQGIYDLVGEKMREIFNPQVIDIVTYDSKTNLIEDKYSYEKGDRTLVGPREPKGFRKYVINTGQILLHNSNVEKAMREFGNEILIGEMPKSQIYVPMMAAGKVTGIISLQNIDHENAFSSSDVSLLSTLANSMSVALESARLFDETTRLLKETEQRTAELGVINSVQDGLAKELDMQAIYELVGDRIRDVFNAQAVIIATLDQETGMEHFKYNIEKGERFYFPPRPYDKLRQHLIDTGEKILINKDAEDAMIRFGMRVLPGTEFSKSLLFVPLMSGDKVKSYVSLQNIDEENAFSESDVRLLETLANSMSVALENARLFDETNRLLKETEQRNAELAVINSVQESLVAQMDMQGIYELVGEKMREIFQPQVIDIVTYDNKTNLIEDRYAYEKGDRTLLGPRLVKGFRKHVIETGQVLLHNDNVEQAMSEFDNEILIGEIPKSQVYVPMIAAGKVTGIISLQNIDHENAFSESDVSLLTTLANSMSVALESARLFDETNRLLKETEQRQAELAVINSVQEGLAKELDMQAIYDLVGNKIRDVFRAQVVLIASLDQETGLEHFKYLIEKGERFYPEPRPYDKLREHLIHTGERILINKHNEDTAASFGMKVVPGTEFPKSILFVPLVSGDKVKSYISLQNVDKENAFSESDVRLLETLANSMSVALENARLFDETNRLLKETEQRNAELAVINSVQESLVAQMDMQGIYDLVGEKMRDIFNAQVIDIVTYDSHRNLIEDRYAYEKGDRTMVSARPPYGFRKHVIETRQTLVVNRDMEKVRKIYDNRVIVGQRAKSIVLVPMLAGGEVTGVISLQNLDQEDAFSESDISLLTTLTNSMSVALKSARLFDETVHLLKETEQRTAELAIINSVQEGLASKLDMQAIYDLVGDKIRDVFSAQGIAIAYFDRQTNMIHHPYYLFRGARVVQQPFELGKGLTSHIIETGHPLLINENAAERYKELGAVFAPSETEETAKSWLGVPLTSNGQVCGTIRLENYERDFAYSESDVSLLQTLANSMSVALENARLFDETNRLLTETEQRTAELAVINSVQEGLAKELDMQAIYDLVGNKVRDVFDAQVVLIASLEQETGLEHFKYVIEKGQRYYPEPRRYDKLRQHLLETKERILINQHNDEVAARFEMRTAPGTESPKSSLFVPLIIGDKVKSYVSLQNVDREHAFSESDVRLLETLANSMSVALENARLFDETNRLLKETEQRTAELAVINSVQEGLAKELDMQAIYDLIGNKVRDVFGAQAVIIAALEQETGLEYFKYVIEKGERYYPEPRPYDKLRRHLIDTGEKILINKGTQDAMIQFGMKVVPGTEFPKSLLFVPLISGDKVKSYVSLQYIDKEDAFTEADVRLLETLANSMSVALENARLFDETNRLLKETEQRTSELAVINSVQDGLGKELDMQAIYELVGDRIRDVFNAQAVIIATLDQETGTEHFKYLIEKGERYYPEARPLDKLRRQLVHTKQKIVIKTIEESEAWFGKTTLPGTEPMKSGIFVPLIIGDKINSYVSLQNVDREHAFSDSDIRLLETLANSMSVALENARLFDETNRLLKETELREAELATINSVQEGLVKEFKSEAIFDLVGERLCELFDTQTVLIRTFDHATGMEHWRYAIEKGQRHYTEPRPLIWANKRLIQTHQPILINENYVETAKKYGGTGVSMGMPPKSAVFVPMIVGDEVRGSVSLQNVDKENAFKESDLKLLTTLTNSMGVALENVRLFDETSRLLDETKQRANELSTVNSISKALASQLNPDELIELVGNQMKDLFHANIVYLALLNPKTKTIHFPYKYGDEMRPLKLGEGLTSRVILTGEPLLINKDVMELRAQLGVRRIGIPAASYLGVPIPVGDEIIGVLSVQSTEHENRFNENDLRLLSTIASSVGVALRNAKLFEEVKKSKREAEAASKAAEKANEAKSAFLSTVSHELRTPLTSVLGFAKIIRKRLEEKIFPTIDKTDTKNEKVVNQITENLGVVIAEGERLTHLINDVLDLAKIEAGKMEWNYDNVSLAEVAERAIAATTSLFDQKGLKLEKQIEPDLPTISGDRDKLIQVIINLISNAVKFTNQGSVTCRVYQQNEELVVDIADTGIGIAAVDHAAVFEQFKQVGGDTLTDKPKGTGLGLPICKQIVEHHGGRIWLQSEPGKGSTFSFAIPIVKKETLTPVHLNELLKQLKEQMAQSKFKTEGKSATILVVDDDDSIRSLLHQELSDAGYLIEEATNGKQALERVRQNRPDLIILDIMMPEMNGFDVAAILKNDPETMDIPIIVLSIVQDKARGFRIGVDRYLTKPIDTAQLFTEVGALLGQGKSKKKVLVVDEDTAAVRSLTDVLQAKGYHVVESDGKEMVEKAIATQPDIIILNSIQTGKNEAMQALRFEKGLENVLFLMYQ